MAAECEVRTNVREIQNGIRSANDPKKFLECLKELRQYLPDSETCWTDTKTSVPVVKKNEGKIAIFMKHHYPNIARFLLDSMTLENVGSLSKSEFSQYCMYYFMCGNSEDAYLTLTNAVYSTSPSFKLNKSVMILEEFLKRHKLVWMLCEQSALYKDEETPMYNWRSDGRVLLWDTLVTEIAALPDKMSNKLKSETSDLFLTKHYIPLLVSDILRTLVIVCKRVRLSKDCHLEFISRLVGKLCLCGHADQFWSLMLKQTSTLLRKDFIWSRVCERIIIGVPDRCVESVLVPLIKLLPWYGFLDRYLGNCVTQKQKIQLLLCTKLIFHRYYKSPLILQNIIGYLATSVPRQHLFVKLLLELVQVWGDQSSLNHTSYEQHHYLTQALVICVAFITEQQKQQHKDEILRLMMPGIQTHIGSTEPNIRKLGMFVAEVVTKTIDPDGPKLDFQSEEDGEIKELKRLLQIPEDPVIDFMDDESVMLLSENARELVLFGLDDETILDDSADISSTGAQSQSLPQPETQEPVSDLDSDDDLEPYDMSHDTNSSKVKQPKYIRDCMEGLINCETPDILNACLGISETLIRANPDGLNPISAEFAKILLHLSNTFSLPNFRSQRLGALVALTVTCPKEVAEFLTEQFYDRNYNIRQRLDIIEVIGIAAQELSRPTDSNKKPTRPESQKIEVFEDPGEMTQTWRDVVQKRIDSKTRRFGTRKNKTEAVPVENKFAPVAGYFFYPLMKNFDRPGNTFDLLGEDCCVLSNMMYTLGMVMYSASNIPTVRQMASCLLEFIWVLRFHTDANVRQSLLFAISMVYLAVPPSVLMTDLQQEVFESKNWLEDVIDKDVDTRCKVLATEALVLLENLIKQTVRQMASCLLEFIWVLRFHTDANVRQSLLFAISMVYLAVPPSVLMTDLQQEVFESKNWLEDVIDKDVDTRCKVLATEALVLLENLIKQTVRQMASCLLEFIWVLRFHADANVRQSLLFAISMVYLAVPPSVLMTDLQQEVFESKNWLEDVIDKDVDTRCKVLATEALVLLENLIKQTVRQMASCLLEFIWVLRFHTDANVRHSLLFAISMVYLAVPPSVLMTDLQQEVFESKNWLEDVIDKDVDTRCKVLATEALVLLETL